MIRTSLVVLLTLGVLLAGLAGWVGRGQNRGNGGELHTVYIRVHPDDATVTVRNPQRVVIAEISQRGPRTFFSLPQGSYAYRVSAQGHAPFEGRLSIPENKNLEVWLELQ